MAISSPRINVMLDSVRSASKQLIRDFNELQISSVKPADFINETYSKTKQLMYDCLKNCNQIYDFIFEDDVDQDLKEGSYTWFTMPIESKEDLFSCMVHFSVSVCLIHKIKVVPAVIDDPALRETFWAEKKKAAFLEDFKSRHVKMRMKAREGGIIDTSGDLINKLPLDNNSLRSLGSSVLGFAYLAAGKYNGIIYSGISKYKTSLGMLFLQERGGKLMEDDALLIAGDKN